MARRPLREGAIPVFWEKKTELRAVGQEKRVDTVCNGMRTCVSCSGIFAKSELIRYVWRVDQAVEDPQQRAGGRGAYSCRNEGCIELFFKQRKKWRRLFRLA